MTSEYVCRIIAGANDMDWNKMNEICVEKLWNEMYERRKNLLTSRFVHHETHMDWPRLELETPAVRGELLTACATESPQSSTICIILTLKYWATLYKCKLQVFKVLKLLKSTTEVKNVPTLFLPSLFNSSKRQRKNSVFKFSTTVSSSVIFNVCRDKSWELLPYTNRLA